VDIIWSNKAKIRIEEILNYYKQINRNIAIHIFSEFKKTINNLKLFPYIGSVEPELIEYSYVYRYLLIKNKYKIIYSVDDKNNKIQIITIWDCRKNPTKMKNEINN